MTHVVAKPCFGCKYTDCVVVCPVECFREGEQILAGLIPEQRRIVLNTKHLGLFEEKPGLERSTIGHEAGQTGDITFYGSSFITDNTGAMVAEAGRSEEAVLVAKFDAEELRNQRAAWGLFRDRRPELYGSIVTLDGQSGLA